MIIWQLKNVEEANAIIAVLGKVSYDQVSDLIARLKQQTELQEKLIAQAP